jgi:hypothetical protein
VAKAIPSFSAFERRAREAFAAIPKEFTEDVEDVLVHRDVKRHPQIPDVVTLGECEASPLTALTDAGVVRSIVHLWYGSFVDLARRDATFDVDAELVETIEHEVKHHLEDKGGTRALEDEDDLFDAHARFLEGLPVPAGWYRQGELLEPGVWAVEGDLFVEVRLRAKELLERRGTTLSMKVLGEPLEIEIPSDASPGGRVTIEGEGLAFDDEPGHEHGHSHAPRAASETDEREGARDGEDDEGAGDLHVVWVVR